MQLDQSVKIENERRNFVRQETRSLEQPSILRLQSAQDAAKAFFKPRCVMSKRHCTLSFGSWLIDDRSGNYDRYRWFSFSSS